MKNFWKDALIRAVRTFCQVLATLIGTDYVNIVELNWPQMLGIAATSAVVSILTSVSTGLPETAYKMELESYNNILDEEHEVE